MSTKKLTQIAVVAALYAVLTFALAPISYGNIQFRISEVMVLLAFINPIYIVGLTMGCLIANLLGPNGMMDVVLGTFATFISVVAVSLTAKFTKQSKVGLVIASIWPTLFNAIIIGWMLHYLFALPLFLTAAQVAIGEFAVVTLMGVPVFLIILQKYKHLFLKHL